MRLCQLMAGPSLLCRGEGSLQQCLEDGDRVGIPSLSCATLSHSIRVGSFDVLPWMDLMISPVTLRPYLTSLSPPQVERKYFHSGPLAFSLSAKSVVIY